MEGNPGTEKKTEKIDSVGRMGPKSVRIFGGGPKTEKKTEKKIDSVGKDGSKILEDVWWES